ncbi:MAG: hypothetical protein IJW86_08740 [Clostridia bacterium]|nr:hypothetical protein [Clostridia bacterium]
MEFIFEMLYEIIMEPIVEAWVSAMSTFSDKKVNAQKIKVLVCLECIILLLLFFIGGGILLETEGTSLTGKILFATSIIVSLVQIIIGIILKKELKRIRIYPDFLL